MAMVKNAEMRRERETERDRERDLQEEGETLDLSPLNPDFPSSSLLFSPAQFITFILCTIYNIHMYAYIHAIM